MSPAVGPLTPVQGAREALVHTAPLGVGLPSAASPGVKGQRGELADFPPSCFPPAQSQLGLKGHGH